MQPLCATAKREKSRRRGTLPCGKLPENKESAPEGAPIAPQNVKTPHRACARRRKWSLNHFCRRHVRRRKSFSARKRALEERALRRAAIPSNGRVLPRRALPFEYKKGAPEGAPPPQCRRGQIRTCTTRQVGRRPIASALPTSGKKPGGLQFTAGDRRPLYLMWV